MAKKLQETRKWKKGIKLFKIIRKLSCFCRQSCLFTPSVLLELVVVESPLFKRFKYLFFYLFNLFLFFCFFWTKI